MTRLSLFASHISHFVFTLLAAIIADAMMPIRCHYAAYYFRRYYFADSMLSFSSTPFRYAAFITPYFAIIFFAIIAIIIIAIRCYPLCYAMISSEADTLPCCCHWRMP